MFIEKEVGVVNTVRTHFHKRRKCRNVETNFPFLSHGIAFTGCCRQECQPPAKKEEKKKERKTKMLGMLDASQCLQ